jgi:5-(carboxyamino)imidazole ribonucleotide mutase
MAAAHEALNDLGVEHECRVLSAHRTPDALFSYMADAEARGVRVFIGGAGGAAHLPGVIASKTIKPVLGVPVESKLNGLDSLLSIAQMPAGIPVGALAVGRAGAANAGLLAAAILATEDESLARKIHEYRKTRADKILADPDPSKGH